MRRVRTLHTDEGMSLVELIVAVAVSAVMLSLIAVIFGQGLNTQQQQAARSAATNQLNAVSVYINESMRNAVEARTAEGDTRLDLKVLNTSGTAFECRSWKIDDEKLWYSGGVGPRGALQMTPPTDWAVLASPIVNTPGDATTPSEPSSFTGGAGRNVSYLLNISDGDVSVTIHDGGYPGAKTSLGGATCW